MDYGEFLDGKAQVGTACGFDPLWVPDSLYPFQRHLVDWSIRRGRAAVFADCGLGKTYMQLVWAENVVRKTNRPVLIATPLAVGRQTVREAERFGVDAVRSQDGKIPPGGARVVVTNYERLHHFDPADFAGVVDDESGCVKDCKSVTRDAVIEFNRTLPYRLLCTATAAPNDYVELGNSAEALGEMGFQDMATRFFKKETSKDRLGWGRTKYRMRGHAARDFWRWVCSWARAVRKPSDLGFDDGPFVLPSLAITEHVVKAPLPDGVMFDMPALRLPEQRAECRRTLRERCERAAELLTAQPDEPGLAWCHLNPEGDMLARMIPGAGQISGKDSDEAKEEKLAAFASGQMRVLVTKPTLAGFGLNWQHCSRMTFFVGHSFEQFYQCVRRCYRFGQTRPVEVGVITSPGLAGVQANLQRKQEAADVMFARLVEMMNDTLRIDRSREYPAIATAPAWMAAAL